MYININLLPQELRPKKPGLQLNVQTILVLIVIAAIAGMGFYYYTVGKSLQGLERQQQSLSNQQKQLTAAVNLQKEVDALTEKVRERVNIIKELTADSDLRFAMMQHINGILPENLWLLSIVENEEPDKVSYTIEGMAYSKESISSFLEGLEKYEKFTNVALKSIKPSPMEIRDAFSYIVTVELARYQPPKPPEEKTAKSAAKKSTAKKPEKPEKKE